jgi:hypothetical protein
LKPIEKKGKIMRKTRRYIEINGMPAIIDFPENPSFEDVNQWIRDWIRYQGDFAALMRPVQGSDIYPEGEYLEVRIIIGRKPETEG